MQPFISEAKRLRAQRAKDDPQAAGRVDTELNRRRVNFLLFGYGETHEPPLTERAFIGSYTVVSYDYRRGALDLVSLTHDIRAPEIERYQQSRQTDGVGPIKIDRAYQFGGFDLMRTTLENATGLAIDFQIAFAEAGLASATDQVFGGVQVDVPLPFEVNAFYLDGKKYPKGSFAPGLQTFDGTRVLQYIKTVPVERVYDKRLEHNARKHQVMRGFTQRLRERSNDVGFWLGALRFVNGEVGSGTIAYDFDVKALLANNLGEIAASVGAALGRSESSAGVPEVDRTVYVVDPSSGDGGVQWVNANAATNPATRADLAAGRYVDTAMEVPYAGDPYAANLATGYWPDVRRVVRQRIALN